MAWIRLVADHEATGALAAHFAAARARAGKVWNIVRLMSPNPAVLEASMGLYRAVMFGPSPLARRQREMLAVIVSRGNGCHY
jgi:alkylhydroperoxidase family enzyme